MSPHRIRLHGPWQCVRLDDCGRPAGEPIALRHPDDWPRIAGDGGGTVELTRVFHAPTNLDETERLFVVLTGIHGRGSVRLNDGLVGEFGPDQTSVECRLPLPLPHLNRLAITITFPAAPSPSAVGLYGTVALEIRRRTADD